MNEDNFHPNPQVRRAREAASAEKKQPVKKEPAANEGDEHEPAIMVETHRHDDGSYHTITHHKDGSSEHTDHASHDEAKAHQDQVFGEDGGEPNDLLEEETNEPCPDCDGEGCESCGGTGMKKAEGEEY